MDLPKKSLGQHWLSDEASLKYIVDCANVTSSDTVLEIGPGTGNLTKKLLATGATLVAVEKDKTLAKNLLHHISSILEYRPLNGGLTVIEGDILEFDMSQLPHDYKVVANIPYYLTSNLLRVLSESLNPPVLMVLLVQKEVAQRIAASPGQMSLLGVSIQLYYQPTLGKIISARLFTPPPKVDSQIVILQHRGEPLFKDLDGQRFFQVVKAGFSQRRKKLRSSLSGGLGITKEQSDNLLKRAGVATDARAQELNLQQWYNLYKFF